MQCALRDRSSFEPTRYGRHYKVGLWYSANCLSSALECLPTWAAQLERQAPNPTMKPPLGTDIATRELVFVRETGESEIALVSLGKPVKSGPTGPWLCPYQIRTPSFGISFAVAGEDSMQALVLCVHVISAELIALERKHKGIFNHYGRRDLGFPDADAMAPK